MITVSQATSGDIPALLCMIEELCAHHGDTSVMNPRRAKAKLIDGPLSAFLARNGTVPVGYCVLEPHWRPTEHGDLMDIAHLFVKEGVRGQGVGKALIAKATAHARDVGACRLVIGTSAANPEAADIYRAMGLAEIANQPGPRFEIAL